MLLCEIYTIRNVDYFNRSQYQNTSFFNYYLKIMGQTNQCCQSPFTDHKKFDLNQVKIYWPQVAQQIIMLRKINAHQISLKTHQQKIINENKQNQQLKSNKRVYKQFITSSHCFFGYISNDLNDSKTQYQQTPTNISSKNKPYFKSTRSSIKNKQNQSNLSFLPSIYKLNDFAILIHKDKACYMGNFKDSLFHGKGILHSLETNDRFDGIFEYGQRVNGKYENNEIKYTGTFKNNQLSGKGKLQYKKTNDIYEGEIHHGKMHGKGRIIYSSGDVYQGHFSNGIYHGEGIYYWSSGEIYKGSYKKGIKHGFGIMTIDGKSHELCWVNGKAEGKPMNYQEFQLKSKKQIKVAKTRQDLTKQEKVKEKQFEEDQDEVTSIIMNHHRIIKTQSFLY